MSNTKNDTQDYTLTDNLIALGAQVGSQLILGKCLDVVGEALLPPELKAAHKVLLLGGRYVLVAATGLSFWNATRETSADVRKAISGIGKSKDCELKVDNKKNSKKEKETI